jgi:trimethylamine--corrinoid protein Co-methyltransferase
MRPKIRFLSDELILKIIAEAKEILCTLGIEINNDGILSFFSDSGAKVDFKKSHVVLTEEIINRSLETVPHSFKLYDINGNQTHDFSGYNIHFTPGSAALNILDPNSKEIRKPVTKDYINYVKIISQLENIASQSTAFIPADVHQNISDSYRLFLSLLYSVKPVVTGAFTIESFEVMKNFLLTVRGSEGELRQKPLSIFSCCPSSPLKWSDVTSQNVIDCAHYSIPVEFISMPLSGFVSPVTLTGTLIQHTVETLSGITISQLSNPGTPILYGGSPAIFDVRYETTPMGAVETMMIDCAYNEIGKYLGIPTQAYISLTDAKLLDAQSGIETAMGATMAALAGINNISGPGMIDFESCISLEKLVIDNEVCGMLFRMLKGIEPKEDFPALPLFEELLNEEHLLISKHTRKYIRDEHYFPGPVINRANRSRWQDEGASTLENRAHREVKKLLATYEPSSLSKEIKSELINLMVREASKFSQETLPTRDE